MIKKLKDLPKSVQYIMALILASLFLKYSIDNTPSWNMDLFLPAQLGMSFVIFMLIALILLHLRNKT